MEFLGKGGLGLRMGFDICWVKGEDLGFSDVWQAEVGNRDKERE